MDNNRAEPNDEHEHPCRRCIVPACNLKCSIKNPVSDKELHRIHKEGDPRWRILNHNLKCPKCVDIFNQLETLDNHLHNEHSIFTDYAELSLASDC